MINPECKTCAWEQNNGPINPTLSHKEAGKLVGCNEASIRRHRKHANNSTPAPKAKPLEGATGEFKYGADGQVQSGDFANVKNEGALSNWDHVFAKFGLDPEQFEIVGDTVRASTWQQSRGQDDGTRDLIDMYSYRASFRRITDDNLTDEDIEAACERVRSWNIKPSHHKASGAPVAAILNLSDMQLFKSEGGGVDATLDRLRDGLENFITEIHRQRLTHNINELVIVNNGDPFEGIAGNYASQTHTVQGGLRAQMNLVLDVWMNFAKILYPMFEKGQFVSVLCNHTEFGRQGGAAKSITSDSDNGSAFLAETLERVLRMSPAFDHVDFTIPHDEMNVYTEAAGVTMAFNHGHKIPGNDVTGFEKWLNGQVRGDRDAANARIWVTAHRHNFQAWDLGSTFAFSTPSCDGGSKWLRDATGRFSRSGILSFLVGNHHHLGWSDVAFL